jgi:hypothetical protein
MQANTLTPQKLFEHQVRYVIPVFQRPYVWQIEKQWEPLWDDVRAVAEELLDAKASTGSQPVAPHFLGAVVLDQQPSPSGYIAIRHVIDGQQRLITLQLLLNAVRQVATARGRPRDAALLTTLVRNPEHVIDTADELLKVWPIIPDRGPFIRAMDDNHGNDEGEHLINQAINFLRDRITAWALTPETQHPAAERLQALTMALAQHLKLVVIDLEPGDNAQAIFEALNDRGSPLLAADLVKNAVFQAAEKQGLDVEDLNQRYWSSLDEAYWREELRQGRLNRPRIDVFLNYWLTMRRAHVVPSDRIFTDFRDHVLAGTPDVRPVLDELRTDSTCYRELAHQPTYSVPGTFHYRVIEVMDIAATMPMLLWLMRPASKIPTHARDTALRALENWIIRRALCRVTLADTNSLMVELLNQLRGVAPDDVGAATERFLAGQTSDTRRWPTDGEVIDSLTTLRLYKVFVPRRRARMLLEALEDDLRSPMTEDTHCSRGALTIEHVMPQSWRQHWTSPGDDAAADERDAIIHTLGNLTLLTGKLNPHVSNNPWLSTTVNGKAVQGKRDALSQHSVLRLNNHLVTHSPAEWTDDDIRARSIHLAERITTIWSRP